MLKPNSVRLNLALVLLLYAIGIVITVEYVSSEHAFYFWDFANYQYSTQQLLGEFNKSPANALTALSDSFVQDYNFLPTLLLVPFMAVFGQSRQAFEVGLVAVYLLPFALIIGLLAKKLIAARSFPVFWSAVVLTLLLPVNWAATLRGYPDVGAACLIGLAIWLYLQNIGIKQLWKYALIGVLFALAMLFRRHFIYEITAFTFTAGLTALYTFVKSPADKRKSALQKLIAQIVGMSLAGGVAFLTLALIAPKFIVKLLSINVNSVYSSYARPWPEVAGWFGTSFGWLAFILAIAGFGLGFYYRSLKPEGWFIALFGIFSFLQWIFLVGQTFIHFTYHLALVVTLGLLTLGWTVWQNRQKTVVKVVGGVLGLYLVANIAASFFLVADPLATPLPRSLLTSYYAPLIREDYTEISRIVSFLAQQQPTPPKVYVASSSEVFNSGVFKNAEIVLYGKENFKISWLEGEEIDSRDFYPLTELIQAQYVLLINPFQHQMPADQQKIVKVAYDMFSQNWGFAQDFTALPERYKLKDEATATIFKRLKPSSFETVLTSVERIATYGPFRNPRWVPLVPLLPPADIAPNYDLVTFYTDFNSGPATPDTLLYAGNLREKFTLKGTVKLYESGCKSVTLNFIMLDGEGKEVTRIPYQVGSQDFSQEFLRENAQFLLVKIVPPPNPDCRVLLDLSLN